MTGFRDRVVESLMQLYYTDTPSAERSVNAAKTYVTAPTGGTAVGAHPDLIPTISKPPERRQPRQRLPEQRSLFGEILDWMIAPLLLVWPVSVAITFVVARDMADRPYDTALSTQTQRIADQIRLTDDKITLPVEALLLASNRDSNLKIQIIGKAGELLAGSADLPRPKLYDFPEFGSLKLRNDSYQGDEVRIAYTYLFPGIEADAPALLVQVQESQENRVQLTNEIIKGVILPQFLILPLAGALVWFGLYRGLAPLQLMQSKIRARRPDDQSPIDPAGVPSEISPLVDSFNDLLLRLTDSINSQKHFVADAAHQIKTPLAGLRTQAELALRQSDPQEVKASLERVVRGTERAARLVNQLLALARTDVQQEPLPLIPIDLGNLARQLTSDWVERARAQRSDLGFESDGSPAPARGHSLLLQEMLGNLIDNALRYTPSDSVITVRVRSTEHTVLLEVEDDGPGIAAQERPRVFDRFYRVLGTGIEGSGLGLAIVKEIAEQHGASIHLNDTYPGQYPPGLRVQLEFTRGSL